MRAIRTFRDLVVWQKAFELCVDVYRITELYPDRERYGMIAELRKTARSVLYNIAEGHKRFSTLETSDSWISPTVRQRSWKRSSI